MFNEIEHVHITTKNLRDSVKFYTNVLGFKIQEKLMVYPTNWASTAADSI
jgi:catechol 2,3-dioxygenase-like lactoylglutathione lyase family enzyme